MEATPEEAYLSASSAERHEIAQERPVLRIRCSRDAISGARRAAISALRVRDAASALPPDVPSRIPLYHR